MRLPLITSAALALYGGMLAGLRAAGTHSADVLWIAAAMALVLVWRYPALLRVAILGAAGAVLGLAAGTEARAGCTARLLDGERVRAQGVALALPAGGVVAVHASQALVGGRTVACGAELRARFRGEPPDLQGEIALYGRWWAAPRHGSWPPRPGRGGVLLVDSVETAGARAPALLRVRLRAQALARAVFGADAGTVEALLLGRGEGLERERRDAYAASGLAHILSISGFHVGLIAAALAVLAGLARLPAQRAAPAVAVVTLAYVVLIGAPAPAVRSALQVLLLLGARTMQRPTSPYAPLAAAGVFILLIDPLQAIDIGFQLSFAGTAGLVALRRRIHGRLGRLPRALRENLAAGAAATLATMPLTALHFGQVAPVGVLANLVAVPLAALAVPAAALALLCGAIWLEAGRFLAGGAGLLLRGLDASAYAAARVPFGHAATDVVSLALWGAGVAAAVLLVRGGRQSRRAVPLTVLVAAVVAWPGVAARIGGGALEIHMIDVGQGDAIAIRTPARRWILVDAGPRLDEHDAGRDVVVPYLERRGVRRIDLLAISHPDADHIGGAAAVLDALDVTAVMDPGNAVARPQYLETLAAARAEPAAWLVGRAGRELAVDDVVLEVLHPGPILDASGETNDLGLIFRLEYGRFSALFTGDASAAVEEAVIARAGGSLRSDVLKVGHHGSTTSTSAALLDAVEPDVALVSVGRRNRYGHPAREVLARLEAEGIEVRRTDLEGAIVVSVHQDGSFTVRSERGRVSERRTTSSASSSARW